MLPAHYQHHWPCQVARIFNRDALQHLSAAYHVMIQVLSCSLSEWVAFYERMSKIPTGWQAYRDHLTRHLPGQADRAILPNSAVFFFTAAGTILYQGNPIDPEQTQEKVPSDRGVVIVVRAEICLCRDLMARPVNIEQTQEKILSDGGVIIVVRVEIYLHHDLMVNSINIKQTQEKVLSD